MGGGDLNLKKSWAVNIQANQRKVWEAEKKAIDERKRAAEVLKEREEERAVEELRKLQMEATGKTDLIDPKVAWMYQDAKNGLEQEASEAYLLGKRRVDQIILKQDTQQEDLKRNQDPLGSAISARDISSKAALDPLLAIEKQRTANLQALMADPIARQRMMREMSRKGKDEEKRERRHRKDRDDSLDRHHRSRRRRHGDENRDGRRDRRQYRDDNSRDRHERRRYRDDSEEGRRESRRHREESEDDRRERRRWRGYDDGERHSKKPYREDQHEERQKHMSRRDDRRRQRSRSRSPYRPRQREEHPSNSSISSRSTSPDLKRQAEAEERAARLAAMSANANDLEEARNRRLAEMEARDASDKAKDDRRRDKRGDRFISDLREQADSKTLGDRLQRVNGGLARLEGAV